MQNANVLTITQLNMYVKGLLESDPNIKKVYVVGEISNFTNHYKSGHFYLTLKDDKAAIKAVMFRTSAFKLAFTPQNGMRVICSGRVSLFERDGSYQFYIDDMQPDGVGALQIAYEQLKNRLADAGIFDDINKQPIPAIPERIAVITSPTGAAVQDIINILSRRFPIAEVVMCPALVQGELAPNSLSDAVETVNELDCADVIIIGRGGGSLEDLWAFNSEKLAMSIFNSRIPVISAVGHETDFTICDFVADLRAPTPSAAAELAVPDMRELHDFLDGCKKRIEIGCKSVIFDCESKVKLLASHRVLQSPMSYFDHMNEILDSSERDINASFERIVERSATRLAVLSAKLDALSPLKTLSRGYSIVMDDNSHIIKSSEDIAVGDNATVTLSKGKFDAVINKIYSE